MRTLAAVALALATLLALAVLFGGRPAAAQDDGPYLPPDPVAVPNTPFPPTPTPTGTIQVYHCGREELQNPPAPQAVWGTVNGSTIQLHYSMRSEIPEPVEIEVEFTRAIEGEANYIMRKDVRDFGPLTFNAPYPGPYLAKARFRYPCLSAGRILFVYSAPGKDIEGKIPFFFVRGAPTP